MHDASQESCLFPLFPCAIIRCSQKSLGYKVLWLHFGVGLFLLILVV